MASFTGRRLSNCEAEAVSGLKFDVYATVTEGNRSDVEISSYWSHLVDSIQTTPDFPDICQQLVSVEKKTTYYNPPPAPVYLDTTALLASGVDGDLPQLVALIIDAFIVASFVAIVLVRRKLLQNEQREEESKTKRGRAQIIPKQREPAQEAKPSKQLERARAARAARTARAAGAAGAVGTARAGRSADRNSANARPAQTTPRGTAAVRGRPGRASQADGLATSRVIQALRDAVRTPSQPPPAKKTVPRKTRNDIRKEYTHSAFI